MAETGLDFRFLFALYEGGSGAPATADDCEAYAEVIGDPDFPVFADDGGLIPATTPMQLNTHPQMCAISPEFEIIGCEMGHGKYDDSLDAIRAHAGL